MSFQSKYCLFPSEKYNDHYIDDMLEAIKNKKSYSWVRIGDGELVFFQQEYIKPIKDILQQVGWSKNNTYCGAKIPNLELRDRIVESAKNSDLVGVFQGDPPMLEIFEKININPKSICYAFDNVFLPMNAKFVNRILLKNRLFIVGMKSDFYKQKFKEILGVDVVGTATIKDYSEIISRDSSYSSGNKKILLYGHSMSCAFALEVAGKVPKVDGVILVNPPIKLKPSRGMSPGLLNYLKYIGYFIFAPHTPIVNMAGDPSLIEDESDRKESEQRNHDPLLVKYFSMHYMTESKKIMDAMVENARQAGCPLLLLYGDKDMIVDKAGCDEIYSSWKGHNKNYEIINGGSHGKSTAIKGAGIITQWIESI